MASPAGTPAQASKPSKPSNMSSLAAMASRHRSSEAAATAAAASVANGVSMSRQPSAMVRPGPLECTASDVYSDQVRTASRTRAVCTSSCMSNRGAPSHQLSAAAVYPKYWKDEAFSHWSWHPSTGNCRCRTPAGDSVHKPSPSCTRPLGACCSKPWCFGMMDCNCRACWSAMVTVLVKCTNPVATAAYANSAAANAPATVTSDRRSIDTLRGARPDAANASAPRRTLSPHPERATAQGPTADIAWI